MPQTAYFNLMENLFNNYKLPELKKERTSERAELIKVFVERLRNPKGEKYRASFIGMKLAHLNITDLYFLVKKCEQSSNFGKTFWSSIKVKQ